jgi:hypothetical protein
MTTSNARSASRSGSLVVRYALFAALSIAINLATQYLALLAYLGFGALPIAIAAGTLTGLVTKYLLDKRWIFFDPSRGSRAHARRFSLYTFTGLFTTAIFWGTELLFASLSSQQWVQFMGGLLGLTVGYVVKYRLDRRFVFQAAAS